MKDEKYYTPIIEEFHLGFEYETKNNFMDGTVKSKKDYDESKWNKNVFGFDGAYILRALTGENAKNGLCGIRVKYLDKEDVELLGLIWNEEKKVFISKDKKWGFVCNSDFSSYENKGIRVGITFLKHNIPAFNGYIKNKSEFKKLMQQLGI